MLHHCPDSPKFSKKPLIKNFSRNSAIQTHPFLSSIATGFISSIKVSIKSFLVVEIFSNVILSILFLELEYWPSDIPRNAIYDVSIRYWNSWFSVSRGFVSSVLVTAENLRLLEIFWQIKPLIFPPHQNFYVPKIPKYATTSDFSRPSKSSLIGNYRLHIFHQGRNQSVSTFEEY